MTLTDFINHPHALMIAPAGHGKTHAIAQCIKQCQQEGRILILTHTHAGIASIKAKMLKLDVPTKKYHVETICGFVQRYVLGLGQSNELPLVENKDYFSKILEQGVALFSLPSVLNIIKISYEGLYVDEYQDCTIEQHKIITEIAKYLPTHLFGDPLQGIFDFNSKLVDFNSKLVDFEKDLEGWTRFECLDIPRRWESTNPKLGEAIKEIRGHLLTGSPFRIPHNITEIKVVNINGKAEQESLRILGKIIKEEQSSSVLVIEPSYFERGRLKGGIYDRVKLLPRFDYGHQLYLLEALDDKKYYTIATACDKIIYRLNNPRTRTSTFTIIREWLINDCNFAETVVNDWISDDRVKEKRGENSSKAQQLSAIFEELSVHKNVSSLYKLTYYFIDIIKVRIHRPDIIKALCHCMRESMENNRSVEESMRTFRNVIRCNGQHIKGRCYGSTLLTKGLEFDVVIIRNAHLFQDAKNFYVAISRACRKLIVLTAKEEFYFDN